MWSVTSGTSRGQEGKGERMEPPEIVEVETTRVHCDGNGPLGHPRVYLNLGDRRQIDCPYCGRRFVLKEGAKAAAAH